ncbi:MAG: MutS-related protein [Vulcanimicrobiaceae bacterium]
MQPDRHDVPEFFVDLNLDQIVDGIVEEKDDYELRPFFFSALHDATTIRYRHEVFKDFEDAQLLERVRVFGRRLAEMRAHLVQASKIRHLHERNAWFLEAVGMYCVAVRRLSDDVTATSARSQGIKALRDYLVQYVASERFRALGDEMAQIQKGLTEIRYAILIREGAFTVRRYDEEPDYSAEVDATFAKFKQSDAKDYRVRFSSVFPEMNHIEQQVLTFVAQLFPTEFADLDEFCRRNRDYLDPAISRFDREVQFYLAYLDYIAPLRATGLRFCYPELAEGPAKAIRSREGFDVALAHKLRERATPVVTNDFFLAGPERILVVSGPNQGGKSTFARAFGQMHFLTALGCLVPGSEARLYLFDRIFTQFEREESIENLRGKLEDDLHRLRDIIDSSTGSSVVVLNEIFNSTAVRDAIFLSAQIVERLLERDVLGVWVTFIDEIASFDEKTVSMVSTVNPDNLAERTFEIVRRPADGLAYAHAIAEKHRVTYRALRERIL